MGPRPQTAVPVAGPASGRLNANAQRGRWVRRREALALVSLVAVIGAPFLNKAYTVDDTLMLRVAENVLISPFEPFMGEFDSVGRVMPVWRITTNPPRTTRSTAPNDSGETRYSITSS